MLTIRGIVIDEYSLNNIIDALFKDIHKKKQANLIDDIYRYHHKQKSKNLKREIYRYLYKRQNEPIFNELKELKRLKRSNLIKKENISQEDLKEIKRLYDLPRDTSITKISSITKCRNYRINKFRSFFQIKFIYILLRSQKHHPETKYLEYLQVDPINYKKSIINEIRKYIIKLGMSMDKSNKYKIKKRLDEIDRMTNINRSEKTRLLNELSKILSDLEYKRKYISSAYDSSDYYELKDLEYTFGDLDDYYKPMLAKESFNGSYQMYTFRGDKDRDMNISMYLDKVKPYLVALIDEKKLSHQKIQLDIAINLRPITKNDRITFYVKSKILYVYHQIIQKIY